MRPLELILFATDPPLVCRGARAGIHSMMVDLEWRDKETRQRGQGQLIDTEINRDLPRDLETLRVHAVPSRYCRLNRFGSWTEDEVAAALAAGATHMLLPMVESAQEVEATLGLVDGRCGLGILVETARAVDRAKQLAELPLDRVYVGLNDLAISRDAESIFDALADGTVESLRRTFAHHVFGFGGVTAIDGGDPVPCRLLMAEMARLECSFTFLRRSFKRDMKVFEGKGRDMAVEVQRIHRLWRALGARSADEAARDHEALLASLSRLAPAGPVR